MNYSEVVSPPTNRKLTTLKAVKTELEITDTSQDVFLLSLIEEASSMIREYTGREWAQATYIEYVAGGNNFSLVLNNFPIQNIEYVKVYGREIDKLYYLVDKEAGILFGSSGWGATFLLMAGFSSPIPAGIVPTYEVKYTAGYVLLGEQGEGEKLPPAIERVCKDLVKVLYFARKRDDAVQSERLGDYSVSYKESKIMEILHLLDRFKRVI